MMVLERDWKEGRRGKIEDGGWGGEIITKVLLTTPT